MRMSPRAWQAEQAYSNCPPILDNIRRACIIRGSFQFSCHCDPGKYRRLRAGMGQRRLAGSKFGGWWKTRVQGNLAPPAWCVLSLLF